MVELAHELPDYPSGWAIGQKAGAFGNDPLFGGEMAEIAVWKRALMAAEARGGE